MSDLYRFTDIDGDKLAVFIADIPGHGPGVNIRTTRSGVSIPVADIPDLIDALATALAAAPSPEAALDRPTDPGEA